MDSFSSLIYLAFFLLLSAFFSGSETAFFSINKIHSKKIEKRNTYFSKLITKLLKNPRKLLITILLGNTFANVAAAIIGADLAIKLLKDSNLPTSAVLFLSGLIMTVLLIIFGEISPKLYAYSKSEQFAAFSGLFINFIQIILHPLIFILVLISKTCSKKSESFDITKTDITPEDFKNLVTSKSDSNILKEDEKKIIAGIFKFSSTTAKEIMIPRVDIIGVNIIDNISALKKCIVESGHSRIPVYKKNIDEIVGIIYSKDIILNPEKTDLSNLLRRPIFITENTKINDLLNLFKVKKTHLAIVVDEYGGTSGLITLEDVLEELVGEIMDEFDNETPQITKLSDNEYLISPMLNISTINSEFDLDLDEDKYENVAAFLYDTFNKIPKKNENLNYKDKVTFTVVNIENQRINNVKITISEEISANKS